MARLDAAQTSLSFRVREAGSGRVGDRNVLGAFNAMSPNPDAQTPLIQLLMDRLKALEKDKAEQLVQERDGKQAGCKVLGMLERKVKALHRRDGAAQYRKEDNADVSAQLQMEHTQAVQRLALAQTEASSNKMKERRKALFGKKMGEYRERFYQMLSYNVCLLGYGSAG